MIRLALENYIPKRNCIENEIECRNSYEHKICAKEEFKHVACATYERRLCYDEALGVRILQTTNNYKFNYTTDQYALVVVYDF